MGKIWLIVQREYWIRVRKRSFIIMTLLSPILFAAIFILPAWFTASSSFSEEKTIEVLDMNGWVAPQLDNKEKIKFISVKTDSSTARKNFLNTDHYALLIVPKLDLDQPSGIRLISKKNTSMEVEFAIKKQLEKIIRDKKIERLGIEKQQIENIQTSIDITTENQEGKKSSSGIIYAVGFLFAFIMYMSVLLYGVQVMRGVIEEKTNRIVEVIISSVKPMQLMFGKIIGIAAVGVTQFLLWIILTFSVSTVATSALGINNASQGPIEQVSSPGITRGAQQNIPFEKILEGINNLNLPLIIGTFLFYFVFGYLLYSALFAAVGSAGDNETDAQQFTLPVTLPLILSIVLAQAVLKDPNGTLSFWLSVIPFTSPIIMMIRIPAGVPTWELLLSAVCLLGGFVLATWVAARIYRVGILMYGKKINYKEISKWLFYKS